MGRPPAYYKDIGKLYRDKGEVMPPPDLKMLTKNSKEYILRFQGIGGRHEDPFAQKLCQIPLQSSNCFLPYDQPNLGVKYPAEVLKQYEINVDHAFLRSLKRDVEYPEDSNQPTRTVADYNIKLELKNMAINIHKLYIETLNLLNQPGKQE